MRDPHATRYLLPVAVAALLAGIHGVALGQRFNRTWRLPKAEAQKMEATGVVTLSDQ